MQQLIKLADILWVHEDNMAMLGCIHLPLRMTIVKLTKGGLWIHSPTVLTDELKQEIATLGAVDFIIGPSNGHNLWLNQWQQAYPNARLYISAGIAKKLAIQNYQILDENFINIWQEDLEHIYIEGIPFFNESNFLHKSSNSLIVTDLIQNHTEQRPTGFSGLITRFIVEPLGFKGKCLAPPIKWGFAIKNKAEFASSIKKIQDWEFDRIIVTHGEIIEDNAKQVFLGLTERFFSTHELK